MSTIHPNPLNALEQEQFAAMTERMRQLRRHAGVPDGMTAQQAVALHMISSEELERARWDTAGDTLDRPGPIA
jgi:hypothetical protein